MKTQSNIGFISSIVLHGIFVLALLLTWKTKPLIDDKQTIAVSIIADNNSAIGEITPAPENKEVIEAPKEIEKPEEVETQPSPEEEIIKAEPEVKEAVKPELTPKKLEKAPEALPKPKVQPPITKPINKPIPAKPDIKQLEKSRTIINNKPNKTPIKPEPKPQAKPPIEAAKPKAQKAITKPNNQELSPQFDIAAASNSASGLVANERRSPKLSTGIASPKSKGGGEKLQSDLASILRAQIKNCWAEPADLSNPQALIVEVEMHLNNDGNLARKPKLINPTNITSASPSLKVAIDNALSAARQCAPYDLPQDRYDDWASFTFRFDPREMKR